MLHGLHCALCVCCAGQVLFLGVWWCCLPLLLLSQSQIASVLGPGSFMLLGFWRWLPIEFVQVELGFVGQLLAFLVGSFCVWGWPCQRLWCGGGLLVSCPQLIVSCVSFASFIWRLLAVSA